MFHSTMAYCITTIKSPHLINLKLEINHSLLNRLMILSIFWFRLISGVIIQLI